MRITWREKQSKSEPEMSVSVEVSRAVTFHGPTIFRLRNPEDLMSNNLVTENQTDQTLQTSSQRITVPLIVGRPSPASLRMDHSTYPSDVHFAGLIEAATAAADAHQRDLGKRKRGEEDAYTPVSTGAVANEPTKTPTLTNSAAILFREPSEKSKKYSRPPLGKVFTSLQLAPEAFLRLQHAAKAYMLNDDFPERKDVVGHKKLSNNNDVAKLKLYECVEEFLQQDGIGEQFFGHSSSEDTADAQPRTFFWPEDRNKIVKLLMPLLRKMVTNERQRIYAAETRKQDPRRSEDRSQRTKAPLAEDKELAADTTELVSPVIVYHGYCGVELLLTSKQAPEIDPSLQDQPKQESSTTLPMLPAPIPEEVGPVILKVNVVRNEDSMQKRVAPEIAMSSADAPTIEQFQAELRKQYEDMPQALMIKIWQADGVSIIHDNVEWLSAQLSVGMYEWMDGTLKVLVEI